MKLKELTIVLGEFRYTQMYFNIVAMSLKFNKYNRDILEQFELSHNFTDASLTN